MTIMPTVNIEVEVDEDYSDFTKDAAAVEVSGYEESPVLGATVCLTFKFQKGDKKVAYVSYNDLVEALRIVNAVYGKDD